VLRISSEVKIRSVRIALKTVKNARMRVPALDAKMTSCIKTGLVKSVRKVVMLMRGCVKNALVIVRSAVVGCAINVMKDSIMIRIRVGASVTIRRFTI